MNRSGISSQPLRALPNGYPGQQQIPQNRSASSRLPPAVKMGGSSSWQFVGGVPMGSAGLNNSRQSVMSSFAQTAGGSSPAAPLDLADFPSLANPPPQQGSSVWGSNRPAPLSRPQQSQAQPEESFQPQTQGSAGRINQYASQNIIQSSNTNPSEDYPPLGGSSNGDTQPSRLSDLTSTNGFGSANTNNQRGAANGLLSAVTENNTIGSGSRGAPASALSGFRSTTEENDRPGFGAPEAESNGAAYFPSNPSREKVQTELNNGSVNGKDATSGTNPNISASNGTSQIDASDSEEAKPSPYDPLEGMSDIDRYGLAGFDMFMRIPSYRHVSSGPLTSSTNLGFSDASEFWTETQYSLLDNQPAIPALPKFEVPECYTVHNIAPIEERIKNLTDESLLYMFHTMPRDVQQVLAANELYTRNWRYHKVMNVWLTKDEMMVPQNISPGVERGYYIYFNIATWERTRRELTLVISDLEDRAP